MRVPLSWLREYVAWDGSAEELAELLSMSGSEVEGIDWVGRAARADNLALLPRGRVLTKERHPNADKLWLCTVDVGAAARRRAPDRLRRPELRGRRHGGRLAGRRHARERPQAAQGQPARRRVRRHDALRAGARLRAGEPRHRRAAGPSGRWARRWPTTCRSPRRCSRSRSRPTGPTASRSTAWPARWRRRPGWRSRRRPSPSRPRRRRRRAAIAVEIADPDLCARYGARVVRGVTVGDVAGLAQGAPHARRHAPHQQRGRRDQLRHAGRRPAAARLRRRQHPRRQARSRAAPAPASTSSPSTASSAPLRPDNLVIADTERALVIAGVFGAVDAEVDEADHRPRARGGHLQRPQHHAHLQRGGLAQRSQHALREGPRSLLRAARPGHGQPPVPRALRRRRGARHASMLWGQRPAGAAAPALPPEPLRRPARPARRAARAGRHPAPPGVRGRVGGRHRAGRRSRPRRHAAAVSPRPRAPRRPGRRGRPHPRPREPARDAAAAQRARSAR